MWLKCIFSVFTVRKGSEKKLFLKNTIIFSSGAAQLSGSDDICYPDAVLHFCYPRINLFKLLLCWNLRILWEYSYSLFQMISFLLLATRKSSLCAFHQLHTSQQFSNWCMWLFLFLLSFSKSTEDAWIVFMQVLCGWGNVWGSFSSRERIVVAFHFPGSCFTALGWCHGSVQMIFPPDSLSDNYLKPHPGVILCVGLNQQQGYECSLDLQPCGLPVLKESL